MYISTDREGNCLSYLWLMAPTENSVFRQKNDCRSYYRGGFLFIRNPFIAVCILARSFLSFWQVWLHSPFCADHGGTDMNGLIRNMWTNFCKERSIDNILRMVETWSEMRLHNLDLISYAPSASPSFDRVQGSPTPGKDRQMELLCRYWKDKEIHDRVQDALDQMSVVEQQDFISTFQNGLSGTQTLALDQQELIVKMSIHLEGYPDAETLLDDYILRRDTTIEQLKHDWEMVRKLIPAMIEKYKSFFDSRFSQDEIKDLATTNDWHRKRNTSLVILYLEGEISMAELTTGLQHARGGKKLLNRI